MRLNNIFIRVFTAASHSILPCYKAPSAAATVSNAPARGRRAIPAEGNGTSFIPVLWHEKALLFLQTAPDRRVAAISTVFKTLSREYQCHAVRGVRGELTIWISYLQRISSLSSPFSATPDRSPVPIFRIPLLIVPRAIQQVTLNRARRLSAWLSVCFCEFPWCDSYLPITPFRVLSPARRMQPGTFNFGSIYYFATDEQREILMSSNIKS